MKLLLTLVEVSEATGFSSSKIARLVNEGRFPKAVRIDGNTRWRVRDVTNWSDSLCDDQELVEVKLIKRGRPRLAV
jgi:predicted DNA-binding transcriptional regulator AlpA